MAHDSTLPHGAISRAAERLGVSRAWLNKVIRGRRPAAGALALQILADEELGKRASPPLTFEQLTGVSIPAGTRLQRGVIAVAEPREAPSDTRTMPLPLDGEASR